MNNAKLNASKVLKLLFWAFTAAFLIGAFLASDRSDMFAGLGRLLNYPAQVTKDSFLIGGVSGTFLNAALVGAVCCLLMCIPGFSANGTTAIAYLLTVGFCFWGMNILNILPCMAGAFLYAAVRREKMSSAVNFAMFATGLAPLVTEMFLRYPSPDTIHGYTAVSVCLGIFIGLLIGFLTAVGCGHAPNVHKGYSIYSAALPIGMLGFLLRALLYNTLGNTVPEIKAELSGGFPVICNTFCVVLFVLCAAAGFWLNGKSFRGYGKLLMDPCHKVDFSAKFSPALALMNVGFYGLIIMLYYNLIGATWTGVTIGVVFCMLATGVSGSTPLNIIPIMIGYWLMSFPGATDINAQAIVVGLCFASGLTPVVGQYGSILGIFAGALHYSLVTSVPAMHGGFVFYNGGFTCCLLCIVIIPILEKFLKSKSERLEAKAAKT